MIVYVLGEDPSDGEILLCLATLASDMFLS